MKKEQPQPHHGTTLFLQAKDSNSQQQIQKLKPEFGDLYNPKVLIDSIKELKEEKSARSHVEILQQLVNQLVELDFKELAYPEVKQLREELKNLHPSDPRASEIIKKLERLKVSPKQYRILAIKNIIDFAERNRWGLCKNCDFIYLYNGEFWANIDKETFQKFLGEAAEKMGVKWDNAQDCYFRDSLFKQFISAAYLPTPVSNKDIVLINLKNGTFEIGPQGTRLRPFDPKDFLTYQLPFNYDPQATAPRFQTYLDRVLPDKQRQYVLTEFLGYVFIRNGSTILKEEKALILYGSGANGKSVFFEIVNALLGRHNVSNHPLDLLTSTEHGESYRAMLANKLVNYASEINGRLETSIFKQLVSGEPVSARLKYGQPFEIEQYAKLIFNCNDLPKDVEHTPAYFRRFLIIPFDITIPDEEQDKTLHTKIIGNELSGVFNCVLESLDRLLRQKRFSDCEAAKKALEKYKTESNSVKMFLDENLYKSSSNDYVIIKGLYLDYKAYCIEDGMIPFKKTNFISQLKSLGIHCDRQPGTGKNIAYLRKNEEF